LINRAVAGCRRCQHGNRGARGRPL
jgi:hypothetical protein